MLDAKAERALTEITAQLRAVCGPRLVSVALYGSAASLEYKPGVSDLNLAVVLDELDDAILTALRGHVRRWRRWRVSTPLLIDRAFLQSAVDVFPMELYDIKDRHRVLLGDDVFAPLAIQGAYLCAQCEHEARGKLLRLRELYLEIGDNPRQLRVLMLDSVATFAIIVRALNHVRGIVGGSTAHDSLQIFEREYECHLPVLSRLFRIKRGEDVWGSDVEQTYRRYTTELQSLIAVIDQLRVQAPLPQGQGQSLP